MNRRTLAATAIALAMTAAVTPAASQALRVEPARSVVAPPKPTVETIVQPGITKHEKPTRLTDVLKARERAGIGRPAVLSDSEPTLPIPR